MYYRSTQTNDKHKLRFTKDNQRRQSRESNGRRSNGSQVGVTQSIPKASMAETNSQPLPMWKLKTRRTKQINQNIVMVNLCNQFSVRTFSSSFISINSRTCVISTTHGYLINYSINSISILISCSFDEFLYLASLFARNVFRMT